MNTALLVILSILVGYVLRGLVDAINGHIKALIMGKIMANMEDVAKKLKDLKDNE